MESYKLNYKLSKKIYTIYKKELQINMCYSNIYLIRNCLELSNYNYHIAYGFFVDDEGIFTRHCFILLEDRTIIDPTFFIFAEEEEETAEYFIIKTFNLTDYMEAVIRNKSDLSFGDLLISQEIKTHDNLRKYGYKRNSYEIDEFLMRRLDTIDMQV